jgi:hypothetical protein
MSYPTEKVMSLKFIKRASEKGIERYGTRLALQSSIITKMWRENQKCVRNIFNNRWYESVDIALSFFTVSLAELFQKEYQIVYTGLEEKVDVSERTLSTPKLYVQPDGEDLDQSWLHVRA